MHEEVENQDAELADENEMVREEAKTKTEPVIEPPKPSDSKFVSSRSSFQQFINYHRGRLFDKLSLINFSI